MVDREALDMPEGIFTTKDTVFGIDIAATFECRLALVERHADEFEVVSGKQRPLTTIFLILDNFHNGKITKNIETTLCQGAEKHIVCS